MSIARFMAAQLRQPTGWFGSHVFSPLMNFGNRPIVETAVRLLDIQPQHRVLEIGFGGGAGLTMVAKFAGTGFVAGVDYSPDMVRRAKGRFEQEILAGRMEVKLGDVSQLPFPDEDFDRVLTVNTLYFWPDTMQGLKEIERVLKPDGRMAVAIRSKEKMSKYTVTRHGFRLFSAEELVDVMQRAGLRELRVDHRGQEKTYDQVVVVASRPAEVEQK